jgi:hypothetical protein
MNLKGFTLGVVSAAVLGTCGLALGNSANASSWHKGSPKALIGTWNSDGYASYKFTRNKITVFGKGGGTSKSMYKYLGHKKYSVKYKVQGYHYKETFTYVNKHKIKSEGAYYTR